MFWIEWIPTQALSNTEASLPKICARVKDPESLPLNAFRMMRWWKMYSVDYEQNQKSHKLNRIIIYFSIDATQRINLFWWFSETSHRPWQFQRINRAETRSRVHYRGEIFRGTATKGCLDSGHQGSCSIFRDGFVCVSSMQRTMFQVRFDFCWFQFGRCQLRVMWHCEFRNKLIFPSYLD